MYVCMAFTQEIESRRLHVTSYSLSADKL